MNTSTNTVVSFSAAILPKIEKIKQAISDLVAGDDFDATTLSKLTAELTKLETSHNRAVKSEAKALKAIVALDDDDDDDAQADLEILKSHVRANILSVSDYYYIHNEEKFILARNGVWSVQTDRSLKNHHTSLVPNTEYFRAFIEVLKEDGRWFYGRTSSFKDQPGMLNMLRPDLLTPVEGEPHPIFDLLVKSICGDKVENIEHLEKVIVAKHSAPFQYLLPVVCFSDGGGTGKSLFVSKVVSTIFGASSVNANCRMGDFAGQFNGHLAGKLAILINENCEDTYNHNAIKQIAGSPSITFTNKNQMPYEGDNSALLFVTGNSVAGAIRVGGGDVDRRFSVIKGGANIETYIAPWLQATTGKATSYQEAKAWIVDEGQHILSDPTEAGKWLNALIGRHGSASFVPALHGADYRAVVAIQKPLYDQVFEAIFDTQFNYIKKSLIYDFYQDERKLQGNRAALGKMKFYQLADEWLQKNRPDITQATVNWDSSTANVYIGAMSLGNRTKPKLASNDYFYYDPQDFGRREWKVNL